jgi:hypothetical protein
MNTAGISTGRPAPPPVYRPLPLVTQAKMSSPTVVASRPPVPPVFRSGCAPVMARVVQASLLKEKKGEYFILSSVSSIHLHLNVGLNDHLKIGSKFYPLIKKGVYDEGRVQAALDALLEHWEDKKSDTGYIDSHSASMLACVDWLTHHGAKLPKEKTDEKEEKKEEKKDPPTDGDGGGDFYANFDSLIKEKKLTKEDEEDFI